MCVIYHMSYEFNNWKYFGEVVNFVKRRHPKNFPTWDIKIPRSLKGSGWEDFEGMGQFVWDMRPDNLDEMSIYGVISFKVTKDENLNRSSRGKANG